MTGDSAKHHPSAAIPPPVSSVAAESGKRNGGRVHEIDLLRFLAAVAVVMFHYTFRGYTADNLSPVPFPSLAPVSKYAFLGVELFFMISGFVILMTAGEGNLRRFVVSRAVRLYPAFWVCCSLTTLLAVALGAAEFCVPLRDYLANLTMLNGFAGIQNVDGAYWSLLLEIRFYLFVAAIIAIGQIHRAQAFMVLWLVISVALDFWPVTRLRRLFIADYSSYFIAGSVFFLVWSQGWTRGRCLLLVAAWGHAVFESVRRLPEMAEHHHVEMNPWIVGGVVTGFFGIMLLVVAGRTGWIGRRPWLLAGGLTYPLYLIHQNVGYMIFRRLWPQVNEWALLAGVFLLVLGIAWAVHTLVEKPLARPLRRVLTRLADAVARFFLGWLRRAPHTAPHTAPAQLLPADKL